MKTIFQNPILIRFIRSRLRWKKAIFWYALTLIIAGFMTSMIFITETKRLDISTVDAARSTVFPLIVLQGIILLFLGTGSVATGITRDKVEDVLNYQRMTPISPLCNLFGFLLGLPVREYVMVGITLPFLAFGLIVGQVPFLAWTTFYFIFFLSALLYHATGLTAGLVSKRWRWSGRLAQGLVIVLYFILPQLSHLGFISFEFLTVRPVLADQLYPILYPKSSGDLIALSALAGQEVPFFNFSFSGTIFSILLQGFFLWLLLTMARRKWIHLEAPSMSKPISVVVFLMVLILALGNLWPNLTGKPISLGVFQNAGEGMDPAFLFVAFPLVFGILLLFLGLFLIQIIGTQPDRYRRGWIRARRWNWKKLPLQRDESSAWWVVCIYVVASVGALMLTYSLLHQSYPPKDNKFLDFSNRFFLPLGLSILLFQFLAIREWLGETRIVLYQLIFWIVPILTGALIGAASDSLGDLALWLVGVSPISLIIFGAASIAQAELAQNIPVNVIAARNFAFIFQTALTLWLHFHLFRQFRRIREESKIAPADGENPLMGKISQNKA